MPGITVLLFILLLSLLPLTVVSLKCYTCVYPLISPLLCLLNPVECDTGQRCLFSTGTSEIGSFVLREKSCAAASLCGKSGIKQQARMNFTYYNQCCDSDLCNSATPLSAPCWNYAVLSIINMALSLYLSGV